MAKSKTKWVLNATVFSALRRAFRNSPMVSEALSKSKKEYQEKCKNGKFRRRVHFKCKECGKYFSRKKVNVDHIEPVVDPLKGFTSFDEYIARLFCPTEGLQVLCEPCHKLKTKKEAKVRAKARKSKKSKD